MRTLLVALAVMLAAMIETNHPAFVAAYPEIAEKDREFKEWIEHLRDSLKQE